jgi:hypothetical protein
MFANVTARKLQGIKFEKTLQQLICNQKGRKALGRIYGPVARHVWKGTKHSAA